MNTQEALRALGVREDTLTQEEKDRLDRDGYLLLPCIFTREEAARYGARLDELLALEGERAGLETHQESGADRLSDLINKDSLFDIVLTQPRVLAAVAHVFQDEFKFSSLNSRATLPGLGQQHLHLDLEDHDPLEPGRFLGCNTIWVIDDFTEENGPTRVVPGSHRKFAWPKAEMPDPAAPHPCEIKLTAPAGSVLVVNAHTWHGGTRNNTDRPRRAMHGYFCHRSLPQQMDQRQYLRPETYARLSEAARFLLDV
ncbi:MAG TPA: phytanoyl-CoA dioxygenase family protein [Chthonomonadaceae bacterium]|nr:phytanoyl-CoA dioxygenase family protein [Chthonomonadaceae bacterium]